MKFDEAMSNAEKTGTARRNKSRLIYRRVTWGAGVVFIVALLIWNPEGPVQTYAGHKSEGPKVAQVRKSVPIPTKCPVENPCELTRLSDGSSVLEGVPVGSDVCFDETFWPNIGRLGFTTSFAGSRETAYTCSQSQVATGSCSLTAFDSFRFVPHEEIELPQYWFVPRGTKECKRV